MNIISKKIDFFNEKIGVLTSYLCIPMILITFLVAFMRYVLDFGSIAIQEIIIYLHALIFTIGAAYTLKNNMHVRIDIFYNKFSIGKKRLDYQVHEPIISKSAETHLLRCIKSNYVSSFYQNQCRDQ